jgi:thioredoxin-like negative regulator of GroEL
MADRPLLALVLLAVIACAASQPVSRYIDAQREREKKEMVDRIVAATNNAAKAANHAAETIDNFKILKTPKVVKSFDDGPHSLVVRP